MKVPKDKAFPLRTTGVGHVFDTGMENCELLASCVAHEMVAYGCPVVSDQMPLLLNALSLTCSRFSFVVIVFFVA